MSDLDTLTKVAIYQHFANTGVRPSTADIAAAIGTDVASVRESFKRLRAQRVLALESDGETIRMAPPFSGIATQHTVSAGSQRYFANCAWDALGIAAALKKAAQVHSRCEQSKEPLHLNVGLDGPGPSAWVFHCLVPASKWWDDIVFT